MRILTEQAHAVQFLVVMVLSVFGVWPIAADAFVLPDDARLIIPKLEIDAPIVQAPLGNSTWDVSTLGDNVGFLEYLDWFSSERNTVLVGHVDHGKGYPSIFFELDTLEAGDEITVLDGERERHYVVSEIFTVPDTEISVLYPGDTHKLTLITCDDDTYDAEHAHYADRVVVIALPVD